ncbi:MAG: hypothetical protein U9O06_10300 [Euryarchaeota archaeon]|nr:hypothetical protein [Euryarchaeota archaeon]
MKRRNFILGGGALLTISGSLTATSAGFADSVSSTSDFRVVPYRANTYDASSFDIEPGTENTESTHSWEMEITTGETIDRIEADYEFDTDRASFDLLTDAEVTVEFYDTSTGNPRFETVSLDAADYTGPTATFDITDDATIDGEARVTIGDAQNGNAGIVNPGSGTYEPTLTFFKSDGDRFRIRATLTTSTGDGVFEISNLSTPSEVPVGDEITITFDVTNTGEGTDTRDVDLNIDGSTEKSTDYTLDPTETTSGSFTYTGQSGDKPDFVAEVAGDTAQQSDPITVTGGWSLSLTKSGNGSIHTWSTPGIDFDEDVDSITIGYPSDVFRKSLNFNESDPTVTIDLTNTNDVTILEETTSNGGHTATWDLADGTEDTSIDGDAEITIDRLRDPKNGGEYQADIEIVGVDGGTITDTISFTL